MVAEHKWEGYEENKAGDVEKTTIVEVRPGVMADFKSKEYFEKVDSERREQARMAKAVQIVCKNGAKMEITLPANGTKYSPKSNLAAWKKTYKKLPEAGDEVDSERNDNGFWEIRLLKV